MVKISVEIYFKNGEGKSLIIDNIDTFDYQSNLIRQYSTPLYLFALFVVC